MFRRIVSIVAPLAVLTLSLAAAPAALAGDPCYHGFDIPARSEEATTEIKAAPCAFGPTIAHVPVGATVTWFNGPDFTHLITGANQAWVSRDAELRPGQQVSYRFEKAGIYPYACALHRGMSGAIVVGDVAAPAAGGTTDGAGAGASGGSGGVAAPIIVGGGLAAALAGVALLLVLRRRPVAL